MEERYLGTWVWWDKHGPMPPPLVVWLAGARELPFSLILWPDEFRQPSSPIRNVSFLNSPLPSKCHHNSQLLTLLFFNVKFQSSMSF